MLLLSVANAFGIIVCAAFSLLAFWPFGTMTSTTSAAVAPNAAAAVAATAIIALTAPPSVATRAPSDVPTLKYLALNANALANNAQKSKKSNQAPKFAKAPKIMKTSSSGTGNGLKYNHVSRKSGTTVARNVKMTHK